VCAFLSGVVTRDGRVLVRDTICHRCTIAELGLAPDEVSTWTWTGERPDSLVAWTTSDRDSVLSYGNTRTAMISGLLRKDREWQQWLAVDGTLNLPKIKSANELWLPERVHALLLGGLENAEGLRLPKQVCTLSLRGLPSAKGLVLPDSVCYLDLRGLKSVKWLTLPTQVHTLNLASIDIAEGLRLPDTVRVLYLGNIVSAEGLELPQTVEFLDLSRLTIIDCLSLPEQLQVLYLSSIPSEQARRLRIPRGTHVVTRDCEFIAA